VCAGVFVCCVSAVYVFFAFGDICVHVFVNIALCLCVCVCVYAFHVRVRVVRVCGLLCCVTMYMIVLCVCWMCVFSVLALPCVYLCECVSMSCF